MNAMGMYAVWVGFRKIVKVLSCIFKKKIIKVGKNDLQTEKNENADVYAVEKFHSTTYKICRCEIYSSNKTVNSIANASDADDECDNDCNLDNQINENESKEHLAIESSTSPQTQCIMISVDVHANFRQDSKDYTKIDKFTSTSGDESDIEEKSNKNKRLLSKKKRTELILRRHKKISMLHTNTVFHPLTRRKRTGYLCSKAYILYETCFAEKRTQFQEVFFAYEYGEYKLDELFSIFHDQSPVLLSEPMKDKIMVKIMHTYAWPLPFPIIKYENMSAYKDILKAKHNELNYLKTIIQSACPRNSEFFYIKVISLLAFTYLGEEQLDKAFDCLEEGFRIVHELEPCEWTGWIYLATAFYYICCSVKGGPTDYMEKAKKFLQHATENFQVDIEMGASLNIGNSLCLWWMFLVESDMLTVLVSDTHGEINSPISKPPERSISVQTYRKLQDKHNTCRRILETFDEDIAKIETFPTELEKTRQLKEKYWKSQDAWMKSREWLLALHRQLMKDMNGSPSGVPECIQSMYKRVNVGKIIINVDHDKVPEAKAFVKENSPSVHKLNIICFMPQENKPQYITEDRPEPQYTANALKEGDNEEHLFSDGSKIIAFTDEEIKKLGKENHKDISAKDIKKLGYDISYGTFGGVLINKESDELYGTTGKHCLDRLTEEIERDFFGIAHVKKNVYIEICSNGGNKVFRHVSDEYWGILDSLEVSDGQGVIGIDKAIFKLDKGFITSSFSDLKPKNSDNHPVYWKMYTKDSNQLIGCEVQKNGATTNKRIGYIADVDLDFRVGGKMCEGMFIVCPKDSECFADKGDSGSWVLECVNQQTEGKLYGYVHKVHKNYKHNNDSEVSFVYPHVTFCLRFDNANEALHNKFNVKLDIYKKETDSGYSSLEQQVSSDAASTATKRQRKLSERSKMTQKQTSEDSEFSGDCNKSDGTGGDGMNEYLLNQGAAGGSESDFNVLTNPSEFEDEGQRTDNSNQVYDDLVDSDGAEL